MRDGRELKSTTNASSAKINFENGDENRNEDTNKNKNKNKNDDAGITEKTKTVKNSRINNNMSTSQRVLPAARTLNDHDHDREQTAPRARTGPMTAPPPHHSAELKVSIPSSHVLLLTLNRPEALNAMTPTLESDLRSCLEWFEDEPSLWVCVVTGTGRAFCAGADLKAWNETQQRGQSDEQTRLVTSGSYGGFGALSRRGIGSKNTITSISRKPIIAAVNGIGAFGGGVEIVLNCDLVIASEKAKFALPEVKRGVVAAQGGIPRLTATAGRQLASEMLMLGRPVSAHEAHRRFGFVNEVVPQDRVLARALEWAEEIVQNSSPDAVQCTKRGILLAMQHSDVEEATIEHIRSPESERVYKGENIKEGLNAFAEKRKPAWKNPPKL